MLLALVPFECQCGACGVRPTEGKCESVTIAQIDEQALLDQAEKIRRLVEQTCSLLGKLRTVAVGRLAGLDLERLGAAQKMFLFGALADDIRPVAVALGSTASELDGTARRLDAQLHESSVATIGQANPSTATQISASVRSEMGFDELPAFIDQAQNLEKTLHMAAEESVKLQKSLRPVSLALRSLAATTAIYTSWVVRVEKESEV